MIRHVIAAVAVSLAVWAAVFMAGLDKKADRFGEINKVISASEVKVELQQTGQMIQSTSSAEGAAKQEDDEAAKKLKALKERAGNVMAFKVSPLYKQKCSSCHGVNGEGIIGPKLIGLSQETVTKALQDFKNGIRKNYVMYGLLSKMSDEDIAALSEEIGTFQAKLEAASQ